MNKLIIPFAILVFMALILTACGGAAAAPAVTPLPTPPAPYAGMSNALKGNADAIAQGKTQYDTLCASCHGPDAKGDGPAASALNPKPANLVEVVPTASDAYLFWRISEGGGFPPFNSAMPSHKGTMSDDQIWQVISYLQSLK